METLSLIDNSIKKLDESLQNDREVLDRNKDVMENKYKLKSIIVIDHKKNSGRTHGNKSTVKWKSKKR